MKTYRLLVNEVFHTVEGEGRRLGQRCSFIRLGACSLGCSWCDSRHSWDRSTVDLSEELQSRGVLDLAREVGGHNTRHTVITGGEPLLQQHRPGWSELLRMLLSGGRTVSIETNGTLIPFPTPPGVVWSVSPKLANSDEPEDVRIKPEALAAFVLLAHAHLADFKFVVRDLEDLAEVEALVREHRIPADRVWVMPEGVTPEEIRRHGAAVADRALELGWNITTRLHVQLWGTERGR